MTEGPGWGAGVALGTSASCRVPPLILFGLGDLVTEAIAPPLRASKPFLHPTYLHE